MKRSDVSDEHVLELAIRWRDDPDQPSVVDALVAEGVPRDLAVAKVLHMAGQGLLSCSVSSYYAGPP